MVVHSLSRHSDGLPRIRHAHIDLVFGIRSWPYVDEFGFFLLVQHSTLRENRVITHLAEELLWYF